MTADIAVPAGRLDCNLNADVMTLYSVVGAEAWRILTVTGVLTGCTEVIDEAFLDAYTWIRAEAARRGLGDAWPVWLWAKTTRYELVKQVRHAARYEPGSVLITARIARRRLLLSEFHAWHCVLNHAPVFPQNAIEADIDAFYERLDAEAPGWKRAGTASAWARAELAKTWELIFETGMSPAAAHWQATVAELRITDVTTAVTLASPIPTRRKPGTTTPAP